VRRYNPERVRQGPHLSTDHEHYFVVNGKFIRVQKRVDHKTMQKKGLYEFRWKTVATYKRVDK